MTCCPFDHELASDQGPCKRRVRHCIVQFPLCPSDVYRQSCYRNLYETCTKLMNAMETDYTGGDLFTDLEEQKAMLNILIKTDVELAWPTARAQAHLRQAWRWDQSPD